MTRCLHCRTRVGRMRGLCRPCWSDKSIRPLYPCRPGWRSGGRSRCGSRVKDPSPAALAKRAAACLARRPPGWTDGAQRPRGPTPPRVFKDPRP